MTTKRPTPPPKRPSAPVRPSSHDNNSALLPLALGLSFPVAATILDILGQGLPFSLGSILTVQQTQPLHWLLDLVPVAMLSLPKKKKPSVAATLPASQQPGMRGSTASSAVDPPAQSQKAISTLQNDLTSVKNQLGQVRTREATLTNLIDNAHDAILTLSVEGIVTSVNRGAEEMLGWTRQEMVGQPLNNLLSLSSVPRLDEHLTQILNNPAAPSMIDLEFVHSDGTGLWAEGCSSVIRDAANQPTSLLMIYRDLRHRQQQSASPDEVSHIMTLPQQEESQLQIDPQPQDSPFSAYEVTQNGTLKVPGLFANGDYATDTFSESEAGHTALEPLSEETAQQEQETSLAPVQFALVDDESESPSYVAPSVSTQFSFDEKTAAESQEVSPASVQFALVDEPESTLPPPSLATTQLSIVDKPALGTPHPSFSPFNFSEALSNIGGDENLLAELASIFLEEYPEILGNVRTAVHNNDGESLVYYAHALKGSVSNFVAGDAESAARKLEQIGREGDLADAPEVLSELETALSRLAPALSDLAIQGAA